MKHAPHVLQSTHRGRPAWIVDIPAICTEKRRKKLFRSRAAADKFLRKGFSNAKEVGLRAAFISSAREQKLLRLGRWLEDQGIDPDAIPGMIGKRTPHPESSTLGEASERFLEAKRAQGSRERYLAKFRRTLRLFLLVRRKMSLAEVDLDAVEEFLGRNGYRPATRKSYRSDLGSFFTCCVRRGYRSENRSIPLWPRSSTRRPPGFSPPRKHGP
jgi:hypothetical protein